MIFRVTMKTPDALDDEIARKLGPEDVEEILEKCKKWFLYNEFVTLEIDTDLMVAKVVEHEVQ